MTEEPEVVLDVDGIPIDPAVAELLEAGRAVLDESRELLRALDGIVTDGSGPPPLR